jgi:competence protein ComEC
MKLIPLARILFPFLLGIVLANYWLADIVLEKSTVLQLGVLAAFGFLIICIAVKKIQSTIFCIYPFLFFLGGLSFLLNNPLASTSHFAHLSSEMYDGVVQSVTHKKKTKLIVDLTASYNIKKETKLTTGRCIVFLDSIYQEVSYGDRIVFSGKRSSIEAPKNPEVFNYQRFLFYKKIHGQFFIKNGKWEVVGSGNLGYIKQSTLNARTWCLHTLKKYLKKNENLSIASAMLLGYKEDISKVQQAAFSDTGAIHVLAVSGLHVGLLSSIITLIFLLLPKQLETKVRLASISKIVGIWLFVFLTGSPPSVQRAAIMFSLYYLGSIFSKRKSSYNILSAAALGMLIVDPYQLFMLSFQFSFLALLSILFFTRKFSDHLIFRNIVADYFWKLFCVSCAAQVFIFPISIYYFHQFPSYFWLSSMIVIPAAFVIFGAALVMLVVELIYPDANNFILGPALEYFLSWINKIIYGIQEFPYNKLDLIHFDYVQLGLIYMLIASVMLYPKFKKQSLYIATALFLGLQIYATIKSIKQHQQKKLVVYSVSKSSFIELMIGQETYILCKDQIGNEEYIVKNNRITNGIKKVNSKYQKLPDYIDSQGSVLQINDKLVYILNGEGEINLPSDQAIDLLIVQDVSSEELQQVLNDYKIAKIIIDGNVPYYKVRDWEQSFNEREIAYHNVLTDGSITF